MELHSLLRYAFSVSPISSWSILLFHWPFSPLVSISYLICFPLYILQLLCNCAAAPGSPSISPSTYLSSSRWTANSPWSLSLSQVTRFPLFYMVHALPCIVYKSLSPVSSSSASSMQFSLVSSLPRLALRSLTQKLLNKILLECCNSSWDPP